MERWRSVVLMGEVIPETRHWDEAEGTRAMRSKFVSADYRCSTLTSRLLAFAGRGEIRGSIPELPTPARVVYR